MSPALTGRLLIKPKANVNGTSKISVKVTDPGASVAPSVNSVTRIFTLTIQPVNDIPVFVSTPVAIAVVSEPYEYIVEITDVESNALPFSVLSKPGWLTLAGIEKGKARLSGVPPVGAEERSEVIIQVEDG